MSLTTSKTTGVTKVRVLVVVQDIPVKRYYDKQTRLILHDVQNQSVASHGCFNLYQPFTVTLLHFRNVNLGEIGFVPDRARALSSSSSPDEHTAAEWRAILVSSSCLIPSPFQLPGFFPLAVGLLLFVRYTDRLCYHLTEAQLGCTGSVPLSATLAQSLCRWPGHAGRCDRDCFCAFKFTPRFPRAASVGFGSPPMVT
eukprot:3275905-Rhodomonas_salina.1